MLLVKCLRCQLVCYLLCSQALYVLHVALDKLGLVGATRVDPQVQYNFRNLAVLPVITVS